MNSIHNNGKDDSSIDEGLDKLGLAYGQLQQEEPPELLDQAVLNSAHRAVESKPHWMQFGWLHGLTTAAVFVLAFSIILNQREPALDFEDGTISKQPTRSKVEKETGEQTVIKQVEPRLEKKVKSDDRPDMLKISPVAAPESSAIRASEEEQLALPVSGASGSLYAQDKPAEIREQADQDTTKTGLMQEEVLLDEADSAADAPQAGVVSKIALPAAVSEPGEGDVKDRARTEPEAERQLLAIIRLKQSGDESWRTELESFQESYPNYPIPDELKN